MIYVLVELSVVTVTTYIFSYVVVGIGLALAGAGVWSLVGASLTSAIMQAAWQYILCAIRSALRCAGHLIELLAGSARP